MMEGRGAAEETRALKSEAIKDRTRFSQLLDAAVTDTYEVWELRRTWRRYRQLSADLAETMERLRLSFAEVRALDLHGLLPNLRALEAELDLRFAESERMFAGQAPERQPTAVDLVLNKTQVRALPHFQEAAVAATWSRLKHLELLTRSLFDCVRDIKDFGGGATADYEPQAPAGGLMLDPDRVTSVIRIVAIMWMAYLGLIWRRCGAGRAARAPPCRPDCG